MSRQNEEQNVRSGGDTAVPSRRHGGVLEHSAPYDLRHEAQRIIDAIEPRAGATVTLMCALHEAWQAGTEHRKPVWRFSDEE